jgi:hypothetical protein
VLSAAGMLGPVIDFAGAGSYDAQAAVDPAGNVVLVWSLGRDRV